MPLKELNFTKSFNHILSLILFGVVYILQGTSPRSALSRAQAKDSKGYFSHFFTLSLVKCLENQTCDSGTQTHYQNMTVQKEACKAWPRKLESFSYDRERIGKQIVGSKHQTHYFLFVLIYYYKLNGLFSFTVI